MSTLLQCAACDLPADRQPPVINITQIGDLLLANRKPGALSRLWVRDRHRESCCHLPWVGTASTSMRVRPSHGSALVFRQRSPVAPPMTPKTLSTSDLARAQRTEVRIAEVLHAQREHEQARLVGRFVEGNAHLMATLGRIVGQGRAFESCWRGAALWISIQHANSPSSSACRLAFTTMKSLNSSTASGLPRRGPPASRSHRPKRRTTKTSASH